jgi:hypothetical protein
MPADIMLGQKKYADAEPLLKEGYEGMKQREKTMPAAAKVRLTEALERLVQLYDATGDAERFFDVDIRDYNLWIQEEMPVVLILFDASRRKAYWLGVQLYFREDGTRQPKKGAKSVRVRVPKRQLVNRRAIQKIRDLKFVRQGLKLGGHP